MLTKEQKKCLIDVFRLRHDSENIDEEIYLSLKKLSEKESDEKPTGSFKITERVGKPINHINNFVDTFYSMLFIDANHENAHVMFVEELKKKLYFPDTVGTQNILIYVRDEDVLRVPSYFINEFKQSLGEDATDFIIFPLLLYRTKFPDSSHCNICIYNKVDKNFERFEPYGSLKKGEFYVDYSLKNFFNENFPGVINEYNTPMDICPIYGFQRLQAGEKDKIDTDPVGFCIAWSMWYAELRLFNPKKSQKQVIDFALKTFRENKTSLTKFIRTYNDAIRQFTHDYIQKNVTLDMIKKYGKVEVYTLEGCPSCKLAKDLLKKHNISFTEIAVIDENTDIKKLIEKYPNYVYFSHHKIRPKKNPTFPIIYIQNNTILGGFSDLRKLKEK